MPTCVAALSSVDRHAIAFILNAAEPLVRAEFHADRSTHHSNLQTLDKEF
ncbi:MAG: hypothetical protein IGR80_18325 [Synechococcales cyanobacterium K44_A2020_017]|jgi:hypothetical protein|nr:hypothetical protein [Synechococcales cyanobacterium K44_A2020_017]